MPLIFNSLLHVVTACFLHIIKMTALEGRLLEIQKTIYPNSIFLWKSKHSLSWRVERGWGVTGFPQGAGTGCPGEGQCKYSVWGNRAEQFVFQSILFQFKASLQTDSPRKQATLWLCSVFLNRQKPLNITKVWFVFLCCLSAMMLWTEIK